MYTPWKRQVMMSFSGALMSVFVKEKYKAHFIHIMLMKLMIIIYKQGCQVSVYTAGVLQIYLQTCSHYERVPHEQGWDERGKLQLLCYYSADIVVDWVDVIVGFTRTEKLLLKLWGKIYKTFRTADNKSPVIMIRVTSVLFTGTSSESDSALTHFNQLPFPLTFF